MAGRAHGGLIPAHAGKTYDPSGTAVQLGAHPRSRGENASRITRPKPDSGSSPLTRGKLLREDDVAAKRRLIPAHAGKT